MLGVIAPSAFAQTTTTCPGYPGCTTTTQPQDTFATIDLGLRGLGTSFDVTECNFKPGATIPVVVNDHPAGNVSANSDGCVTLHVEILSQLVVSIEQTLGRHSFAATGLAATGTNAQIKVNGQLFTIGPIGSVVNIVSKGTGANLANRTVTVKFTIVKKSAVDNSGLARTGTTIVRWSPLAVGLIGLGYLLVLASRRRRSSAAE